MSNFNFLKCTESSILGHFLVTFSQICLTKGSDFWRWRALLKGGVSNLKISHPHTKIRGEPPSGPFGLLRGVPPILTNQIIPIINTLCHSTSPLPIHLSVLIAFGMRLALYHTLDLAFVILILWYTY